MWRRPINLVLRRSDLSTPTLETDLCEQRLLPSAVLGDLRPDGEVEVMPRSIARTGMGGRSDADFAGALNQGLILLHPANPRAIVVTDDIAGPAASRPNLSDKCRGEDAAAFCGRI